MLSSFMSEKHTFFNCTHAFLTVMPQPLRVVLQGGQSRIHLSSIPLQLKVVGNSDPDLPDNETSPHLQYFWTCVSSTSVCPQYDANKNSGPLWLIEESQLKINQNYTFKVTVRDTRQILDRQEAEALQEVQVVEVPAPDLIGSCDNSYCDVVQSSSSYTCKTCDLVHPGYSYTINISCPSCPTTVPILYRWSIKPLETSTPEFNWETSTEEGKNVGIGLNKVVVPPWQFVPGAEYELLVTAQYRPTTHSHNETLEALAGLPS